MTEFFETKHKTDYRDEITCPYCGHEHSDSWEIESKDEDTFENECRSCHKPFTVTTSRTVNYSSECKEETHVYVHTPSEDYLDLWRCENCGNYYWERHNDGKAPENAKTA